MHITDTLKGKLSSQQQTNTSLLVTKIKEILKTPIHKLENPIFSFRIINEAAARNSKILAAFYGDLGAEIVAQKDSPLISARVG